MGLRFRKSLNLGPVRINVSKSGIGASAGSKGFRVTKKAGGGTRTTASIPGTGVSYVKETGAHSSEQGDRESVQPSRNIWLFVCLTLVIGLLLIGFIFYLANQSTDQPSSMPGDISQASTSSSAEQNIRAAVEADAAALVSEYFPAESISATRASETKVEISISNVAYDTLSQAEQSAQQLSSALIEDLGISNSVVYLKDSVDNILITVVDGKTTYNAYEKPELENSQEYDPIVWVTDNGSRYHSSSTCSGMKDPSALTLSQAQELGYTACSKCN